MSTVLIAGGTGLIGSRLRVLLKERNHEVLILSRKKRKDADYQYFQWDIDQQFIEEEAIQKADYIINLAGAGIADGLWTKSRKQLIINSRVKTNNLLLAYSQKVKTPKAFVAASAIGFYGEQGDQLVDENSAPPTDGFLSTSTQAWEKSIDNIAKTGIRTVKIRIGIVLSKQGGALAKMLPSFKVGIGTYFGDGSQYYSWIHIDDLCRIFIQAIENEQLAGTYNGVAPHPVTNKVLTKSIKQALSSSALIVPAPSIALRLAMGEMADVVLTSTRVSADKILETGFNFQFPEIIPALKDIIDRKI